MNDLKSLGLDLPVSIVAFFFTMPLCLGIALASGAPLISGLIAGIVGGIFVGLISGSPLGVSGPAAGLAVIVLNAIESLGAFDAFLLAVVIGGVIQLLLGVAKAGILGYFFPSSVIKGMLSGIGILIILKKIPHALGHDTDPIGELGFAQPDGETTISSLRVMLGDYTVAAMIVSGVSLAILLLWDNVLSNKGKFFKLVQGPLVAVAFSIVYQLMASRFFPQFALKADHLVSVPVVQGMSEWGSLLTYPDFSQIGNPVIWITGITLAVVASLETLLCVEATDKLDPQKRVTPTNRELFAQGSGNILSGLIGGLPVTQVIVRSSANIQSGGQTRVSAILHGVFLLTFVLALPSVLNLIPLSALAAILFIVGYKLAKLALFKQMWSQGMTQFLPFIITILGILFTDLLTGIALGMGVALFVLLRAHYQNSHCLHLESSDSSTGRKQVRIRLAEEVTFLNKGGIRRELDTIPDDSTVTIDATATLLVDHDVLEVIHDFKSTAERRGITVEVLGEFGRGTIQPGRRYAAPAQTA